MVCMIQSSSHVHVISTIMSLVISSRARQSPTKLEKALTSRYRIHHHNLSARRCLVRDEVVVPCEWACTCTCTRVCMCRSCGTRSASGGATRRARARAPARRRATSRRRRRPPPGTSRLSSIDSTFVTLHYTTLATPLTFTHYLHKTIMLLKNPRFAKKTPYL